MMFMTENKNTKPKYTIGSVEKACDILLAFDENNNELGVTEIAKKLDLTKSTVHKILLTLEYKGFIEQNESTGKYSLSLRYFQRASGFLNKLNIDTMVKPYLEEILSKFNETVHFGVLSGNEVVILEKMESTQSVSVNSQIGKKSYLYCTSVGKVILASLPRAKIHQYLDNYPRIKHTEFTITDKEQLLNELEQIRQKGYAVDNEERELGVRCVAVPVRNLAGSIIGGMSVTGPKYRMTDERVREIRDFLLAITNSNL